MSAECEVVATFPKVVGKSAGADACLEKFNQCPIINGCLIAKVVPNDNELVPYIDGLVPNNDGQEPNNDELVTNNDKQVPNDKNQCLIKINLYQIIGKQA